MELGVVRVMLGVEDDDVEARGREKPGTQTRTESEEETPSGDVLQGDERRTPQGCQRWDPWKRRRHVEGRGAVPIDQPVELGDVEDEGRDRQRDTERSEPIGGDQGKPAGPGVGFAGGAIPW